MSIHLPRVRNPVQSGEGAQGARGATRGGGGLGGNRRCVGCADGVVGVRMGRRQQITV